MLSLFVNANGKEIESVRSV